jgi:hypothetical protein
MFPQLQESMVEGGMNMRGTSRVKSDEDPAFSESVCAQSDKVASYITEVQFPVEKKGMEEWT